MRPSNISPKVKELLDSMMQAVSGADVTLEDKLTVFDRAIKFEQLKAKISDAEFGKDYDLGDTPDE